MTHERACIRGCTVPDVHYATCAWFGMSEAPAEEVSALQKIEPACGGCAPRVAREGALICDRCYRRILRLLNESPDMLGRMRSIADPTKAVVYSAVRATSAREENPAPIGSDLLDAISQVSANLRSWSMHVDPDSWWALGARAAVGPVRAFKDARTCVDGIVGGLDRIVNDRDLVLSLAEAVLVTHPETVEGGRVWSVADAMSRWGAERRSPDSEYQADVFEELVSDVPEWEDPLVPLAEAAKRVEKSERTLRRWVGEDLVLVERRSRGPRGSVIRWVRMSDVLEAYRVSESRRKVSA